MVNFSSNYQNTEESELVMVKHLSSRIVYVVCPEDVLSSEVKYSNKVFCFPLNNEGHLG